MAADKQEVAYIFDDRFSGNILLDIKTTRHIGPKVLFIRLLIYLGGLDKTKYYYQFTAYEYSIFYCRHYVILWTRFSIPIDVIFS